MAARKPTIARDGYTIHAGFRITTAKSASGTVGYILHLGSHGTDQHNKRRRFPSQEAAFAAAKNEANIRKKETDGARTIGIERAADAHKANELLAGRCTLEQAARFWIAAHPVESGLTVAKLVTRYLSWMETTPRKLKSTKGGGYRQVTIDDAAKRLSLFKKEFGQHDAATLSASQIQTWVDNRKTGPTGINVMIRNVSAMYTWATTLGPLQGLESPARLLKIAHEPEKIPTIWTAKQVEAFLKALPRHKVHFALLFFSGIRPEELYRLTPEHLYSDEIHLTAEHTKTHDPRLVAIYPGKLGSVDRVLPVQTDSAESALHRTN